MFWPHLSFPCDPTKLHTRAQGHTLKPCKWRCFDHCKATKPCKLQSFLTGQHPKILVFPHFCAKSRDTGKQKTCKKTIVWAKGLTEQCQYQNQSCKCIGCLWIAISFGIFREMNPSEPYVIHVPSPHACPDETYMFCDFRVIFSWNHRPTANNKQPKTSVQTLGWEKW